MGIQKQSQSIQIPIGKATAKFRSTIYYKSGNGLVRTKEYLEVGEQAILYSVHENIGDIGAGRFVKEVDSKHFDLIYGTLQILGENVQSCSKNGVNLRPLKIGRKFNVIGIHQSINGYELYQINNLEFLSSADDITFTMGHFVPLENTYSVINNKTIHHSKGQAIPFKSVNNGMLQLLDDSLLDSANVKGQFV